MRQPSSKPRGHQLDTILLSATIFLIVFGLIMISSAGAVKSFQITEGESQYFFFTRQLIFGVAGMIALYFLQRTNYHRLKNIAFPLLVASIIDLILVFIPGIGLKINGSSRWIKLGGFTLQATEVVKIAFIIYLAAWFEKRGKDVKNFSLGLLPFAFLTAVIAFLIILEPDVGTLSVITATAIGMYIIAGATWKHIGAMVAAGATALMVLIQIAPYRLNRFKVFLNPEIDPTGIGYQINQALLAVGSGGILGLGLGHSRQKYNYLPEPINDSIFAIISEELGLIGGILVVFLFLVIAYRGFKIAKAAPDMFGTLIASGVTIWLTLQAFINIGGIIAIIPLTGIPLPFISYGRAALIISLAAIGILLNISRYTTRQNATAIKRTSRKLKIKQRKQSLKSKVPIVKSQP